MFLSDFAELPQEERTKHIDLSTPCELINFSKPYCRETALSKLLELLQLQNNVENRTSSDILCLHHCEHDSSNGWCTNPLHISFGSCKENILMIPLEVRKRTAQAATLGRTSESYQKTVANTDYAKRAEKYAETRGICYTIEHEDGRKFEVFGERNAAKVIGCSRAAITKALQRDGCFVYKKHKGWSIRRN